MPLILTLTLFGLCQALIYNYKTLRQTEEKKPLNWFTRHLPLAFDVKGKIFEAVSKLFNRKPTKKRPEKADNFIIIIRKKKMHIVEK